MSSAIDTMTGAMSDMASTVTSMLADSTATMTMEMPAATSSGASSSSDASMDMDSSMDMGDCTASMFLNYNTVGSCFLSEDWRVTSSGMFAGSCVGVVCLAIFFEFLRRCTKELDKFLVRKHVAGCGCSPVPSDNASGKDARLTSCPPGPAATAVPPFRPNFWQQALRAVLHTMQFTVAYFIMLLAMYYNVYILVCIFLGILIGSYIFQYETIDLSTAYANGNQISTGCCG